MSILAAIKAALILGFLALVFYGGDRVGSAHATAALEAFQAAQAENTAKAVLAERAAGAAESVRVREKLKEYENALPDPVVPGIAHRVFLYANASGCPLPSAATPPSGTVPAGRVPAGDQGSERLLELAQAAAAAAARDAARLNLCREVWPK